MRDASNYFQHPLGRYCGVPPIQWTAPRPRLENTEGTNATLFEEPSCDQRFWSRVPEYADVVMWNINSKLKVFKMSTRSIEAVQRCA